MIPEGGGFMCNIDHYHGFIQNISKKFNDIIGDISVINNTEYGEEFEVSLCRALRHVLPNRYGICRGFMFTIDGMQAGDDIIIYDQIKYPTIRLLEDGTYSQKQHIPFEAVIAYIEAKNTVILENNNNNSLDRAFEQAVSPKRLSRKSVPLVQAMSSITNVTFENLHVQFPSTFPQKLNPLFTAVISRGIRLKKGGDIETSVNAYSKLLEYKFLTDSNSAPDLMILGSDIIVYPTINNVFYSPFFIDGQSKMTSKLKEGIAYGTGLSLMLMAFQNIILGEIDYKKIISDNLGFKDKT